MVEFIWILVEDLGSQGFEFLLFLAEVAGTGGVVLETWLVCGMRKGSTEHTLCFSNKPHFCRSSGWPLLVCISALGQSIVQKDYLPFTVVPSLDGISH
jgi:hypothetical protein